MTSGLRVLLWLLLAPVGASGCRAPAPSMCAHSRIPAADLHVDVAYRAHQRGRSLELSRPDSAVTSAGLRRGGVRLLVLSLFLSAGLRPPRHTIEQFDALLATGEALIRSNPGLFAGDRPVRYLFSVEGAHALAGYESRLPGYLARGVRLFGIVHGLHNQLGASATDRRRRPRGLTPAGRRFVTAVYRAGGLIDVAHAAESTFADIAALARAADRPLIASHAGARAITEHPRNLSDSQLRAIARSGGLVGIDFHSRHLRGREPWSVPRVRTAATMSDLIRHIQHLIAVMGHEHVAIGSDLDGGIAPVVGLADHGGLPVLACALIEQGLPSSEVQALFYDNAARVLGPYLMPVANAARRR